MWVCMAALASRRRVGGVAGTRVAICVCARCWAARGGQRTRGRRTGHTQCPNRHCAVPEHGVKLVGIFLEARDARSDLFITSIDFS